MNTMKPVYKDLNDDDYFSIQKRIDVVEQKLETTNLDILSGINTET